MRRERLISVEKHIGIDHSQPHPGILPADAGLRGHFLDFFGWLSWACERQTH